MAKWAVLLAAAAALAKPGIARAASPDGDHIFIGTVEVKKALPSWTSCTLTAIVNVSSGVPRLKSVVLAGGSVCTSMAFTGLPGVRSLDFSAYPPVVAAPDVGMNVAFPPASCFGDLKFIWGGNSANPRFISFQNLLSDLPGAPPCKIQGTVTQTSGSLNLP